MIVSLVRFGIAPEEQTRVLERDWTAYKPTGFARRHGARRRIAPLATYQDPCLRTYAARIYFFPSGFQFISSVIGAVALSSSVLMRKRPSGATSYCRACAVSS